MRTLPARFVAGQITQGNRGRPNRVLSQTWLSIASGRPKQGTWTPNWRSMTESTAHVAKLTHASGRQGGGDMSPLFGQLIEQTWTEMEEARDRYNQDAKRLRRWQWWFVGMFTFYTTLVGILLFNLMKG